MLTIIGIVLAAVLSIAALMSFIFRTVVATNDVHIVQSRKTTTSYGKDQPTGNTYYAWPSWMPVIGVVTTRLPMSVFSETLSDYAAYDKNRLPFIVDVIAFFRIIDSNTAAQRLASFAELKAQFKGILQGAMRSILASSQIEEILEGRSKFGEAFTVEVDHQLVEWGVKNVKCIELMDLRDAPGSAVIANIMAKKKSLIEMQSRTEVAANMQAAQIAEISAGREVGVQKQQAEQAVGIRTAEAKREVAIAMQQAEQQVKEQERLTAEKSMAVVRVQQVQQAEILKSVNIVNAEQSKSVAITVAEGQKQQTILAAEGTLEQAKRLAEGTRVQGEAKGAADTAVLMAPVTTQITLAKEIGANAEYQKYLVTVRQIEANQVVGIAQATALDKADIRIIANASNPVDGLTAARDLFTTGSGMKLGAVLEGLAGTETGKRVVDAVLKPNGAAAQ